MKHDFDNSATMNDKIKENVEKVFGTTFDETHDWCSTIRGNVTVPIVDNGVEKVQIIAYLKNEQDTTNTIVVLNEEEVNGRNSVTLYYDIPNIAEAVKNKDSVIKAYVVKDELEEFELSLGELTDDEREIILKGCLINYNRV